MKNDAALWQRGMEWGKELLAPPPRSHAEAYRHELKYLISYADKAELAVRMAPVLHLDPHAKQGGTRAEFERILAGDYDFLLHSPHRLCQEFYTECVSNVLRPRVIVDYDREPWILDAGTVRVTFDMGIRAAVGSWDIFDPTLPTLPVLEPGKLVLEVKFTEFLPQIVRDKTAYQHGFTYWNEP